MKKINLILAMLVLLFIASYASTGSTANRDVPEWYEKPSIFYEDYGKDILLGTGMKKSSLPTLSERTATVAAQVDIAQQLNVIIDYYEDKHSNATIFSTEMAIIGSRILARYIASDGTVYIAVVADMKKNQSNLEEKLRDAQASEEEIAFAWRGV